MFQLKISDIGADLVSDDHTVLRADTKHELKEKVHAYLSSTHAARWNGMTHEHRERLKGRVAAAVDDR